MNDARCPFAPTLSRLASPAPSALFELAEIAKFLAGELAPLNQAALAGHIALREFIDVLRPVAQRISQFSDLPYDAATAEHALALLGFVVCSAERHTQDAGLPAGTAVAALAVEDALSHFGNLVGCAPMLTAYSFWVDNKGKISFTGDQQERLFGDCVREIDANNNAAADAIEPIAQLQVTKISEIAERLGAAAILMERVRETYGEFMLKDENGTPNFSGEFFTKTFRQFLVGFPIRGQNITGPNATDLIGTWRVDALLGYSTPWYRSKIENEHLFYVPRRLHAAFFKSWASPCVPAVFARLLGVSLAEISTVTDAELLEMLRATPPGGIAALRNLVNLHTAVVRATGRHRALVVKFLESAANTMTTTERAHLAVSPLAGVGGSAFADFLDPVFEMRRKNAFFARLSNILPNI